MVSFLVLFSLVLMIFTLPETNFNREYAMRHQSTIELKTFVELLSFTDGYNAKLSWIESVRRTVEVLKCPALPWAILNFGIALSAV